MRRYSLLMLAAIMMADAAPGRAATMSCPASMDIATGQVTVPADWQMGSNFLPPDKLELPNTYTSFGSDQTMYCEYQAGPRSLNIWKKLPPNCRKGAGAGWREGVSPGSWGWYCIGPAQSCTFECD